MTDERRLAHSGFTLTRDYSAPVERVWSAFAEEDQKRAWFGDADAFVRGEWAFDFRVGGRDVAEGAFHDGPVSRYVATYTDIVEHVRIVTTYDMWLDGTHMSTSVASYELVPTDRGTRLTHTASTASSSTSSGPTAPTAKPAAEESSTSWAPT